MSEIADILAAEDPGPVWVPIPEWPALGGVYVLPLSGRARDAWDQWRSEHLLADDESGRAADWCGLRAKLISLAVCDQAGTLLAWSDLQVEQLSRKSGAALERIYDRIRAVSGLLAGAVEDAEKNSPADPNGSSGSS